MTYEKEYASKGVAGTALGLSIGALGAMVLGGGCGGNGGGLFNLFGNNNCMWSQREVMLQREIDAVATAQAVTAAVTPYQIREATCDFVRAEKYIPHRDIVYNQSCGYTAPYNGCGCI